MVSEIITHEAIIPRNASLRESSNVTVATDVAEDFVVTDDVTDNVAAVATGNVDAVSVLTVATNAGDAVADQATNRMMLQQTSVSRPRVAILTINTGNYAQFFRSLYPYNRERLLPDCEVTYFVFTDDATMATDYANDASVEVYHQEHWGWPDITLMRFAVFVANDNPQVMQRLQSFDYVFFINANYYAKSIISKEELLCPDTGNLSDLVVTQHFAQHLFRDDLKSFEFDQTSMASMPLLESQEYQLVQFITKLLRHWALLNQPKLDPALHYSTVYLPWQQLDLSGWYATLLSLSQSVNKNSFLAADWSCKQIQDIGNSHDESGSNASNYENLVATLVNEALEWLQQCIDVEVESIKFESPHYGYLVTLLLACEGLFRKVWELEQQRLLRSHFLTLEATEFTTTFKKQLEQALVQLTSIKAEVLATLAIDDSVLGNNFVAVAGSALVSLCYDMLLSGSCEAKSEHLVVTAQQVGALDSANSSRLDNLRDLNYSSDSSDYSKSSDSSDSSNSSNSIASIDTNMSINAANLSKDYWEAANYITALQLLDSQALANFLPLNSFLMSEVDANQNCYRYVSGGFNGGTSYAFLTLCRELLARTKHDRANGKIALWHDESHLNRYIFDVGYHNVKLLHPKYGLCQEYALDCYHVAPRRDIKAIYLNKNSFTHNLLNLRNQSSQAISHNMIDYCLRVENYLDQVDEANPEYAQDGKSCNKFLVISFTYEANLYE